MTTRDKEPVGLGDAPMRAAVLSVFVSGVCLTVGALAFFGFRSAVGVAAGALLATANLALFARIGQAFIAQKGNAAPWTAIAMVKLLALFGGVWFILKTDYVSGLALAAGYGALPIGITVGSLFGPKPGDSPTDPPVDGDDSTPSANADRDVIQRERRGGRSDE